jgi:hypothetical protein
LAAAPPTSAALLVLGCIGYTAEIPLGVPVILAIAIAIAVAVAFLGFSTLVLAILLAILLIVSGPTLRLIRVLVPPDSWNQSGVFQVHIALTVGGTGGRHDQGDYDTGTVRRRF